MKTALKISTILTWFNMIVWGLGVIMMVWAGLVTGNIGMLTIAFFFCVILLHCYAAFQLHKCIRRPEKPLNHQTPAGIRFIGTVAGFLGIIFFTYGLAMLQYPRELLQSMQTMRSQYPEIKYYTVSMLRAMGGFSIFCGLGIVVNVILNFRLLRWYYLMKGMM